MKSGTWKASGMILTIVFLAWLGALPGEEEAPLEPPDPEQKTPLEPPDPLDLPRHSGGKQLPFLSNLLRKDFFKRDLEFNLSTIVTAYEKVGVRDPKWDGPALEFLRASALWLTQSAESPPSPELKRLGDQVVGCTDPLVLYFLGRCRQMSHRREEAELYLEKAFHGLVDVKAQGRARTEYPVFRVLAAMDRYTRLLMEKDVRWYEAGLPYLNTYIRAYLERGPLQTHEPRLVVYHVTDMMTKTLKIADANEICRFALESQKVDRWVAWMIAGRHYKRRAWAARGSGWASSVTPEGWEGFYFHLAESRKYFTQAWELHPEFPEAAGEMISIAMANSGQGRERPRLAGNPAQGAEEGGDGPVEGPRLWFDRAVAAEFDYPLAYTNLMWALRPRWGGRHADMYALGLECKSTGRFDTDVPYVLIQAVLDISEEDGPYGEIWKQSGVYREVREMLLGLIAEPTRTQQQAYYKSLLAAVAWRADQWEDAGRLLEDCGDLVDPKAFRLFSTSASHVWCDVFLAHGQANLARSGGSACEARVGRSARCWSGSPGVHEAGIPRVYLSQVSHGRAGGGSRVSWPAGGVG